MGLLSCFYCGVDSKPLVIFLVGLIGSLSLATVFIGVSFWINGRFKDSEDVKMEVFRAEARD